MPEYGFPRINNLLSFRGAAYGLGPVCAYHWVMTLHQWLGLSAVVLIVGFAIFAFRQGFKVKPDPNNKDLGGLPPGAGML